MSVYKIVADGTDKIYIGSTKRSLKKRFREHMYNYKNNRGNKSCNEILKYENPRIELIEECNDNLKRREGELITEYTDICVNECRNVGLTKSERDRLYYIANQERLKKKRLDYYENHKEEEKNKMKERYEERVKK